MAVLRSIKFVVSGDSDYNLHFTVPPVFEVETYYDKSYHGYVTGVTGTEFLPQTMITIPKAFGGTHFHGFNILDREVVVTFHPLSKLRPSDLRDRVNRISSASKLPGRSGEVWFELSSLYDRSADTVWVGNKAEISDFEFDSFKGSTEGRITFKMPDPYFLTERQGEFIPVSTKRSSDSKKITLSGRPNYTGGEMRGEILYDMTVEMGAIQRGQEIRFYGPEDDEEPSLKIKFLHNESEGVHFLIGKEDILGTSMKFSIRESDLLALGKFPRAHLDETRPYLVIESDITIKYFGLYSYSIALEGF